MSDLALKRTKNGRYDLDYSRGDLVLTDKLENAVLLSLACWSRDDSKKGIANLSPDMGGWWGNSLEDVEIGSKLWKLTNESTDASANKAEIEAKKSLKWMIDDGVAKDVVVNSEIKGGVVLLRINVIRPDSSKEEYRWQVNWEASA